MNNNIHKKITISLIAIAIFIGLSLYAFNVSRKDSMQSMQPVAQPPVTSLLPLSNEKSLFNYSTPIQVGHTNLLIELADTPQKQASGLSNRPLLENNQGMLFDFRNTKTTRPIFWMKDMLFDIDIIWIKNLTVAEITKNVPAPNDNTSDANLIRYTPQTDSDMVLEVRSGWSEENKIKIGDSISF